MHTPTRSLNLAGATNFRDLGGYRTEHGRSVRWRRLFRSDHLAGLTPEDRHALAALGLTRALDFRGIDESAAASYALPGVSRHALPIEPTVVQNINAMLQAGHRLTARDAVALMQQTYRAFVLDNAPRFAELFRHLLDDEAPLVFHCAAGKDRTGFAAALILLALAVPRDAVMRDYLLTNELYRRTHAPQTDTPQEVLDVLWRVQEEFLDAALHAVDAHHGGVDRYLREIGVGERERERLAELYLADRAA
ncbi:MAG TPA: tyrosine-protein phosphatase [Quisquiliibacterium sp.]|nr:tyrosine-protein phosphatase [Quisquiliibacterium sp.]